MSKDAENSVGRNVTIFIMKTKENLFLSKKTYEKPAGHTTYQGEYRKFFPQT